MKLTEYPYLVQSEILHNISYQDLFLLSFVSIKMKNIIKSSQRNRFKNIKSINYKCYRNSHPIVYISLKNGQTEDLLAVTKHRSFEGLRYKPNYFQLNVSGKLIDFTFYENYASSYFGRSATFHPDESTSVIESIHKYNLHFFGDSVEYYWRTTDHEVNIPKLQNVSACMELWYINGGTANLDNFFSATPNLKSINIRTTTPRELIHPDSKIYQAECIATLQRHITFPDIFHHFQGKRAFINCNSCENFHLVEFVKRWKSGKAFQKLELMSFKVYNVAGIPKDKVLKTIGAKRIDATKTPPTHTVPTKVEWFDEEKVDENTEAGPIISHRYVVRKTDKHVASVLIQEDTFRFGVWDMTEEKFLKMVE